MSVASQNLKLHGSDFSLKPVSPLLDKVKAFLLKSPADEIFTVLDVCDKCAISMAHLRFLGQREQLKGFCARAGKRIYYGNPKAIKALLAMMGAQ